MGNKKNAFAVISKIKPKNKICKSINIKGKRNDADQFMYLLLRKLLKISALTII